MERDNYEDPEASLLLQTSTNDHHNSSSVTPVFVFTTFIAVCSSFCYGCALGYSSPAESGIRKELGLSYSVFGSVLTLGALIGAIISGRLADRIGPRRLTCINASDRQTLWLTEIFFFSGWLEIAFANAALCLDIGRISIGFSVGLVSYVKTLNFLMCSVRLKLGKLNQSRMEKVPVYIAEIAPKNVRGGFTLANQLMISSGFGLFFFIGNFLSWRTLALIGAFPCVVQFIGLFFIPESPRWLSQLTSPAFKKSIQKHIIIAHLMRRSKVMAGQRQLTLNRLDPTLLFDFLTPGQLFKLVDNNFYVYKIEICIILQSKTGQEKEVESALRRLRGKDADISKEAADIRDYTESVQEITSGRFLDLFQMRYASALTIGVGIMLCQQLGGVTAISYYLDSIYAQADVSSVIGTTGIAALQIPGALIAVYLMDKWGRRPLLLISGSGFGFCCLFIGSAFCLQEHQYLKHVTPFMVLFGTWGISAFYEIGMSGIPWVIMSEIFPINVKGSAGSLVTSVCWASSGVTAYTFNYIFEWSIPGTFFIFAGIWCMSILFIAKMVPETKGRSLEEIQA
ncbi:hypothetical protein ACFE04_007875 [Oxalis oulophora]